MALILVGVASLLWLIGTFIMAIFRCVPVRAAWDPLLIAQAKCYNFELAFLVTETINCVMDFVIVCMPLFVIRQLQLSLRHKFSISLIFLLGGL